MKIGNDVNQVQITSLNHIQGQDKVVELLKVNLDAYFNNRSNNAANSFGPVLLTGPSGTGKTLTAKAVHSELANLKLIEANGESLNSMCDLNAALLNADDETTLFIDECQALNTKAQHQLLTAISEGVIYVYTSKSKRKVSVPLANFTLIMATTHEHLLQDALRNRIRINCRFNYYSIDDLTLIIKQRADNLKWEYVNENVLSEIAKRSKRTPRLALNKNLQMAWNVCSADNRSVITMKDVYKAFELLEIDELGLDSLERQYLRELANHTSMKLNIISNKLGLPRQTISNVIEPFLIQSELITKKNSERVITSKGRKHLQNTKF